MNGQVFGGGVIVLVVVALWLVYLVPTWQSRSRFHASERNAVRLNQALRVLAETSETPEEVRLELSVRAAYEQQKVIKRAQAERDRAEKERQRLEREIERDRQRAALALTRAQAAAERVARAAAEASARRAHARRVTRLVAFVAAVAGLALTGGGVWLASTGGAAWLAIAGVVVAATGFVVLDRMSAVARRAARERSAQVVAAPPVARATAVVQDVELDPAPARWSPRSLPRPLASAPGSRAATALDAAAARAALERAARDEAHRTRIAAAVAEEAAALPSIPAARAQQRRAASRFAAMGYVDDAEIEAHVRGLLARRAAGE